MDLAAATVSDGPRIGMAMIVRDEAETIERCLASFWDDVDVVAVLDTGSKDKTLEKVAQFASEKQEQSKLRAGTFEWIDDFAAARTAADAMLPDVDWLAWIDADDTLRGGEQLRVLAANAPPQLGGFVAFYDYAQDPHGNCICSLKRERLVRQGAGKWIGRVHEAQVFESSAVTEVPAHMIEWKHAKPPDRVRTGERNRRILKAWLADDPDNARVLHYLGTEELHRGKPKLAMRHFRRYFKLKVGWDDERAQVHRKYAICLLGLGRVEEAMATAFEALRLAPSWPDSYLTLAEASYALGEFERAARWAKHVVDGGVPDTILIINPMEYRFQSRLVLAGALGAMNRIDEAIAVGEEALALLPNHAELRAYYQQWRGHQKREATADTVCKLAELLVAHDEQLAALNLLEDSVPHFVRDHPEIVGRRSALRERVRPLLEPAGYMEHYTTGGSKPEDLIPDDKLEEVAGSLPRSRFLLDGLREQLDQREEVAA